MRTPDNLGDAKVREPVPNPPKSTEVIATSEGATLGYRNHLAEHQRLAHQVFGGVSRPGKAW